jgi:hypothetical protein
MDGVKERVKWCGQDEEVVLWAIPKLNTSNKLKKGVYIPTRNPIKKKIKGAPFGKFLGV